MIKTERTVYCDACGRIISDYQSHETIREYRMNNDICWSETAYYDFCKDCTIAFKDWRDSRKIDKKAGGDDGAND